jgi:serine/threonine protein phosphatase 1
LDALLVQIFEHARVSAPVEKTLVFLGDYIDRGPNSKGVVDRFLALESPTWNLVFLRGNHDQSLLDFLADASFYRAWRSFGAPETLLSYGVMPPRFDRDADFETARQTFAERLPPSHLAFFENLQYSYIQNDYMFVHAGIRPGIPIDDQLSQDMMWIRNEFLSHRCAFEKMIVHGHTPTDRPVKTANRIGIDTGAHATHCLTAAILEGESCNFLQTGKQPSAQSLPEAAIA